VRRIARHGVNDALPTPAIGTAGDRASDLDPKRATLRVGLTIEEVTRSSARSTVSLRDREMPMLKSVAVLVARNDRVHEMIEAQHAIQTRTLTPKSLGPRGRISA